VSVDLSRVPPINPGDVDVCSLAMNVENLHKQMNSMASRLLTVENHTRAAAELANTSTTVMNSDDYWPTLPGMPGNLKGVGKDHPVVDRAGHSSAAVDPVGDTSLKFTEMFLTKDTEGEWFPVKRKARKQPTGIRKNIGAGKSDKIKCADADAHHWHLFAGRLDPNTSDADLMEQLSPGGIRVISCTQLSRKEKWQEKFSAFRVVVDIEDKDTVFIEELWPKGVDVRDWLFKSR